ncbi:hypothetical protein GCM10027562_34790 [Arthrobacter pigmenti]
MLAHPAVPPAGSNPPVAVAQCRLDGRQLRGQGLLDPEHGGSFEPQQAPHGRFAQLPTIGMLPPKMRHRVPHIEGHHVQLRCMCRPEQRLAGHGVALGPTVRSRLPRPPRMGRVDL